MGKISILHCPLPCPFLLILVFLLCLLHTTPYISFLLSHIFIVSLFTQVLVTNISILKSVAAYFLSKHSIFFSLLLICITIVVESSSCVPKLFRNPFGTQKRDIPGLKKYHHQAGLVSLLISFFAFHFLPLYHVPIDPSYGKATAPKHRIYICCIIPTPKKGAYSAYPLVHTENVKLL